MKSLTINDLSRTHELDRKAMSDVPGGMFQYYAPAFDASKHDFSVTAEQLNSQTQSIENNNGVNAAFVDNIHSTIKPTQTASNSLSFYTPAGPRPVLSAHSGQ